MAASIAAFTWIFRRFVTLFAALDASERIEDNKPSPHQPDDHIAARGGQ